MNYVANPNDIEKRNPGITVTIDSVADFTKEVCRVNNELRRNGAWYNEVLLFRGHSDKNYELLPNIGRNKPFSTITSILDEERNLIEMAKFKMPDVFKSDMPPIELLALLQHYGIPTRLLDITENALVALYFSCKNNFEKDGEVFLFINNELDIANYPILNAIADSYRFSRTHGDSLSYFYDNVISQPYFVEQVNMVDCKTDEEKSYWIEECCNRPHFIYAPVRSMRQLLQQGRYILFPNKIVSSTEKGFFEKNEKMFDLKIEPISKEDPCIAERIIIPANKKPFIKNELQLFGISEEYLFADSIDKVCEKIYERLKDKITGRKLYI